MIYDRAEKKHDHVPMTASLRISHLSVGATLVLITIMVIYEISFSIPVADDYTYAGLMAQFGFIRGLHQDYFGWSGRFSASGLELILNSLISTDSCYEWSLLLMYVAAITLSYFSIRFVFIIDRVEAAVLALALQVVTWCVTTDPKQSFFWLTGAIENYFNISVFIFLCAVMLRLTAEGRRPAAGKIIALSLASFITVGFQELYGAAFVGAISLLVLGMFVHHRVVTSWPLVIVGSATLGLAIVTIAPGNAGRLSMIPQDFDRFQAILSSIDHVLPTLENLPKAVVIVQGAILFASHRRISLAPGIASFVSVKWIAIFLITLIPTMFCIPAAIQGHIELRTVDGIIYMALVSFYLRIGIIAHGGVKPEPQCDRRQPTITKPAILFCVGIFATPNVASAFVDCIFISSSFRKTYSERVRLLEQTRGRADAHILLAPFPQRPRATFFGDVSTDPEYYVNIGVARHYGVGDVRLGKENHVSFGGSNTAVE